MSFFGYYLRTIAVLLLSIAVLFAGLRCGDDGKKFSPTVALLVCPPDTVVQGVPCVFAWDGSDRDGRVEGYYYGFNDDTPEIWTAAESCTALVVPVGRNVFYVLAEDDEGRRSEPASCSFNVVASGCYLLPPALDFGAVEIGADSTIGFSIVNGGQFEVQGAVSESCEAYEIAAGAGPFTLNGGGSHDVAVVFSPVQCGTAGCVIDMDAGGCPDLACTGVGVTYCCDIAPGALDFGEVDLGSSSDLDFAVTNTGCGALSGNLAESCGEYSIIGDSSFHLEPGQSRSFTVRFTPASCVTSTCAIEVRCKAPASISCSGSGTGGACDVHPAVLDFGTVGRTLEAERSFRILNPGCVQLEGYTSEDCPVFTVESGPSWALSPGESTEVTVKFAPLSCDDESTCWIDLGNSLADSVYCTGIVGCGCWVSDEDMYHDFGCLEEDLSRSKDFYIKNLGTDTLRVDIRIKPGCEGGFKIALGGGYDAIAPDEEHQVVVRFSVGDADKYNCYLDLGECGEIQLVGSRCGGGDPPLPTADPRCGR